tara:strand:+ start:503 stop:835 length:333 start_codon:yes stop_codon:yes gene_type:complete
MKFSKRDIVQKLVVVPKKARRAFWAKQMAIFNKLLEKFPSKKFWQKVCFDKKYEGMEYLFSEYGLKLVEKKYRDFHYKIPPAPAFEFSDTKLGTAPSAQTAPTNIKEFLK